jgi:transposase InsO family protein
MTGRIENNVHDIMDMWVCDTMIIRLSTMNGCKYIFLIMDVYSSKLFISLHKTKDEIASSLIHSIIQQQTQTNKILKRLHSDNGTEMKNDKVRKFLYDQGTMFTMCTPYTPQHNALIERKNRTVIEMIKSIMHHAKAYIRFYGEALHSSVSIL